MLKGHSPQMMAQTFGRLSKPLPTLGVIDLNGNCLIQVGFYPKIESGYTLSDILQPQEEIGEEHYPSRTSQERLLKYKEVEQIQIVSPQDKEQILKEVIFLYKVNRVATSED